MAHLAYHNMTVLINNTVYESHKDLVEKVVKEMGGDSAKADELVKKLLDKPDLKAKKDPNKPKRPKSAFLIFCDDERSKLIEKEKSKLKKGEKFSLGVVQKKLGELWKKLPDSKKKKYEEQTEKEKEEYYDKITEYETSLETNA
jgi:hypothetical protein|tara:strand:+ start:2623 stop:3054 length:432 start_codon:yes stop_codon:yes gene_type:complete